MKITKETLKKLIKEELLREYFDYSPMSPQSTTAGRLPSSNDVETIEDEGESNIDDKDLKTQFPAEILTAVAKRIGNLTIEPIAQEDGFSALGDQNQEQSHSDFYIGTLLKSIGIKAPPQQEMLSRDIYENQNVTSGPGSKYTKVLDAGYYVLESGKGIARRVIAGPFNSDEEARQWLIDRIARKDLENPATSFHGPVV